MDTTSYYIYMIVATVAVILLFIFCGKINRWVKKVMVKERKERVQIAELDRDNGEAERNIRMTQGGQFTLSSSLARGTADNVGLNLYCLDKDYKKLKLKLSKEQAKELNVGDIGMATYKGEALISFERTGNVKGEDQKSIKLNM